MVILWEEVKEEFRHRGGCSSEEALEKAASAKAEKLQSKGTGEEEIARRGAGA